MSAEAPGYCDSLDRIKTYLAAEGFQLCAVPGEEKYGIYRPAEIPKKAASKTPPEKTETPVRLEKAPGALCGHAVPLSEGHWGIVTQDSRLLASWVHYQLMHGMRAKP